MKSNPSKVLLIFIFLFSVQSLCAKMDSISRKKSYHTWVITNYRHRTSEGVLFSLQDSSISILERSSAPFYDKNLKVKTFDIKSVDVLNFREKGTRGKTMLTCSLAGLGVGLLVSLFSGIDKNEPMKYILPIMFTGLGFGVGAIFGSIKIVVPIKGNIEYYKTVQNELKKYKYKN
jgi:hypothetical protein